MIIIHERAAARPIPQSGLPAHPHSSRKPLTEAPETDFRLKCSRAGGGAIRESALSRSRRKD